MCTQQIEGLGRPVDLVCTTVQAALRWVLGRRTIRCTRTHTRGEYAEVSPTLALSPNSVLRRRSRGSSGEALKCSRSPTPTPTST